MTTPKRHLDPDAPAEDEERAAADALREALADPSRRDADADFARALSLAHAPREIAKDEHRAIVERALSAPIAGGRAGGRVFRVVFGGAALLAAAAAVALYLGQSHDGELTRTSAGASLVRVRSTQSLFDAPFAARGGASARIDRIAMARATDLRENEFHRWGVR